MKKSELAAFIKEEILSTLGEDKQTQQDIKDTEELTKATAELAKAKKEAGIEEDATPKGEDFTYDYEDIGQFYLEGFGKEHTLTQDQLGKLGKTITKRFYGGDIKKAYDDVYKTSQNAAAKRLADKGKLINPQYMDETSIKEDEDKEPSKADLKKTKGLAKAKEELAQLTKQMKSLARKYKKAEGEEKEKLVADLKKKTKLKKELEAIIDK